MLHVVLRLDKEKDIGIVRQAAKLLERENQRLIEKNLHLTRENLALKGEDPAKLQLLIAALEQDLARVRARMFGDSSEKRPGATTAKEKKPQTGHGSREQAELPIVEEAFVMDAADKVCTSCGGELLAWDGQFEEAEEIDVVERHFVLKKQKRQKYRCQCGACIETAPGPEKLGGGGRYAIDFAIEVAVAKYLDHAPLERQVRIMRREGLSIDSQTLWDQIERLARPLCSAYEKLHSYVLSQPVIGADETRWRLMGAKDNAVSRWQVWIASCRDAVFYAMHDSRSAEAAGKLLVGYKGIVMCDGYGAYDALRKKQKGAFVLAHCWAHVRRKFVDIEEFFPKETGEILGMIAELYVIDGTCPIGSTGDELRRKLREERARDVVRRIEKWAVVTKALPESALGKAIAYMAGMWSGLVRFLADPRIPLDNNGTERAARGPVIGRKNHYGSRSKRGTEVAALFYTLLESAKLAGMEPKAYMRAAARAALRGEDVKLPHEMVADLQNAST